MRMMITGEIAGKQDFGGAEGVNLTWVNLSGKRTFIGRTSGEHPVRGITHGETYVPSFHTDIG